MKRIILLLISIISTGGFFNSCSSFLEEKPVDRFVVGNFYTDQKGAEAGVSAVYNVLRSVYGRNMDIFNSLLTDDEKNGLGMPNQFLQDLEYLRHTSENTFVSSMWQVHYQGVSRANTVIEIVPQISMDETIKNRLIAESRFLRALFYFNLVRFYGDVPLLISLESSLTDAMGPRTSKELVYQQIIDDLTFAENNLPVSYPATEVGRATKGAAKILMGKAYLTMGNYPLCVAKLAEVIESEASYGY
ncbi:MAG: RagB/SusD family nutrient uptake outer membrane protein, partial [Bacteroidota bacterium]|nr:RagB/SusD family nutrient uptake outer membrane protein [Bacteroidota bacterium]